MALWSTRSWVVMEGTKSNSLAAHILPSGRGRWWVDNMELASRACSSGKSCYRDSDGERCGGYMKSLLSGWPVPVT